MANIDKLLELESTIFGYAMSSQQFKHKHVDSLFDIQRNCTCKKSRCQCSTNPCDRFYFKEYMDSSHLIESKTCLDYAQNAIDFLHRKELIDCGVPIFEPKEYTYGGCMFKILYDCDENEECPEILTESTEIETIDPDMPAPDVDNSPISDNLEKQTNPSVIGGSTSPTSSEDSEDSTRSEDSEEQEGPKIIENVENSSTVLNLDTEKLEIVENPIRNDESVDGSGITLNLDSDLEIPKHIELSDS